MAQASLEWDCPGSTPLHQASTVGPALGWEHSRPPSNHGCAWWVCRMGAWGSAPSWEVVLRVGRHGLDRGALFQKLPSKLSSALTKKHLCPGDKPQPGGRRLSLTAPPTPQLAGTGGPEAPALPALLGSPLFWGCRTLT